MKINWKVRVKNRGFWLALIPAVLLLIQAAAGALGFAVDLSGWGERLLAAVNALFGVLAVLGVVQDPTTEGAGDSLLALTYTAPKRKGE